MTALDLLNLLTNCAKDYREDAQVSLERNNHMNEIEPGEVVQQRIIDAVLVGFINNIGAKHGIDYALYTPDLKKQ